MRRSPEVEEVVQRIRKKMRPWGITVSYLAKQLGVSRQYAWQIIHYRSLLSLEKALAIEKRVDKIIEERTHMKTFGDRLRAARISAGLTLKEVAAMIGYTWVGVERWEKNLCLPKPGVLWHLCNLYCVGEDWFNESFPPQAGARPATFRYDRSMGVRGELAAIYLVSSPPGQRREKPRFVNPMSFPDTQQRRAKS
ncbi:MAG: helix-turn-helix transcriptional regulator [Bacteroidota bacterium]